MTVRLHARVGKVGPSTASIDQPIVTAERSLSEVPKIIAMYRSGAHLPGNIPIPIGAFTSTPNRSKA